MKVKLTDKAYYAFSWTMINSGRAGVTESALYEDYKLKWIGGRFFDVTDESLYTAFLLRWS